MNRLLEPETDESAMSPRPIVTIGISAAGIGAAVVVAMKLGLFASMGATATPSAPSIASVSSALAEHQASMEKTSEAEERALVRIVRLLELRCIQDARTAADRDACLRP